MTHGNVYVNMRMSYIPNTSTSCVSTPSSFTYPIHRIWTVLDSNYKLFYPLVCVSEKRYLHTSPSPRIANFIYCGKVRELARGHPVLICASRHRWAEFYSSSGKLLFWRLFGFRDMQNLESFQKSGKVTELRKMDVKYLSLSNQEVVLGRKSSNVPKWGKIFKKTILNFISEAMCVNFSLCFI